MVLSGGEFDVVVSAAASGTLIDFGTGSSRSAAHPG
jgi:hypothetical protein